MSTARRKKTTRKKKTTSRKRKRNGKMTAAALARRAREMKDAEDRAITEACYKEIDKVLKKFGCFMHAIPQMVPTGNGMYMTTASVAISNNPKKEEEESKK